MKPPRLNVSSRKTQTDIGAIVRREDNLAFVFPARMLRLSFLVEVLYERVQ
jgi:hypothetical protein